MNITSNMSDDFFKYYNEAAGVATSKRRILKKKTNKSISYVTKIIILFILLSIINLCLVYSGNWILFCLYFPFSFLQLIFFVTIFIRFIWILYFRRKNGYRMTVTIDEKGLTGEFFKDLTMTFSWNRLKAVVIKKNTVVILTNSKIYFYFTIREKNQILKAIEQYHKNILIIQ